MVAGGPLEGIDGMGSAIDRFDVGETFAAGFSVLFNRTDEPITLIDARPIPGDGELRFLGASVAGLDRATGSRDITDWPVDDPELGPVEPVAGFVLEPGEPSATKGFEVFFGYEVIDPGRSTIRGVEIDYETGGRRYRNRFQLTLALCVGGGTGEDGRVGDCNFEQRDVEQAFDRRTRMMASRKRAATSDDARSTPEAIGGCVSSGRSSTRGMGRRSCRRGFSPVSTSWSSPSCSVTTDPLRRRRAHLPCTASLTRRPLR